MKKTIITLFAFLILFGFAVSGVTAQTWSEPQKINNGPFEDFKAYPDYEVLNGYITPDWTVATWDTAVLGATGSPVASFTELEAEGFVVAPPVGTKYGVYGTTVGMWVEGQGQDQYVALTEQPNVPVDSEMKALEGSFKYIAAGSNGTLYVIFETTTVPAEQYLLVGDSDWEEVTVRFAPRSLNLGSKGRWVTCKISDFPQNEENTYTPADINLDNLCIVSINDQLLETPICRDANGPANNRNKKKLMVKFDRQALATGITALYTADPDNFDLTSVKITVSGYGLDESLQFYGEDIIKTKPAKVKKLKKK